MKCLSIMQPWATLIVLGAKQYETRCWAPGYRGRLAIHASRLLPVIARELCNEEPVRSILRGAGFKSWADLPRGALLGTVRLADCLPADEVPALSETELALGDFRPGRWAWRLADPRPLPRPLPMSGRLGIYDIVYDFERREGGSWPGGQE
jgi:hypothetical protein